jgi:ankyrin repeat protein
MHSEELRTAAKEGHAETVVALLARGADVHCKTNLGYGSWAASSCRSVVTTSTTRVGAKGVAVWPCRQTALHWASNNGHTETAMALAKAGADVHCKDNDGYSNLLTVLGPASLCRLGYHSAGRTVRPLGGGAARSACFGCAG